MGGERGTTKNQHGGQKSLDSPVFGQRGANKGLIWRYLGSGTGSRPLGRVRGGVCGYMGRSWSAWSRHAGRDARDLPPPKNLPPEILVLFWGDWWGPNGCHGWWQHPDGRYFGQRAACSRPLGATTGDMRAGGVRGVRQNLQIRLISRQDARFWPISATF